MTDVTGAVERAAKVLRDEVDGHRVAAVIERGVMWSLEPLVEEWRVVRDAKQDPDILTRFVRESCSSRDNARRQDEVADAIETILSDHARLSAALGEAREALSPLVPADEASAAFFEAMDRDETISVTLPVRCILRARRARTALQQQEQNT